MSSNHDKRMLDREAVRSVIQQWNTNRLDLFALSEPDENLLFHGVMRFYFQDAGQKIATKCIRVASDATVSDVIETLIQKFRPDMRMLSVPNYALYEVHANGEERRLNQDEKPLLVQLNWHIDDREGRFLLKNIDQKTTPLDNNELNFKRKLSKREKKEQKKKEKLAKLNSDVVSGGGSILTNSSGDMDNHVAERLYTELPETSFTRSISNPEAVMKRRRAQKLEKKLQQFRSKDGGPDTGGTLKIYGESLCQDVPYKTLLLSIRDCAQAVVREMLAKYGLDKVDPLLYCLVQVNSDGTEYILDDDECPLSILMNHPTSRGSIMFHVRRRPADSQPRRRKKKSFGVSNGANHHSTEREGPMLIEVTHSGDGARRIKLSGDPIEVGSANTNSLQLFGPSIQPRHCLISLVEGVCTVTPLHADALTFVNGHHIGQPTILHNGSVVMFGRVASYRFMDSPSDGRYNLALSQSQLDSACLYESRSPQSPGSWNDDDGNMSTGTMKNDNGNGSITTIEDKTKVHLDGQGRLKETEFTYDPSMVDGATTAETETKSICSNKSGGSTQESRLQKYPSEMQGQEPILPAVLEFPETYQDNFLRQVIIDLDVNAPNFKLAPVYTLYLCARYRASTHYRPELQPTERAHKLTIFLHHVANLIHSTVQDQYTDPRILAFWMANSSEFLHFLKSDRHISAFSVQAQEVLAESVQTAFRNLVNCFRMELSQTLNQFISETIDHDSAAGLVLTVLGSVMALLRRCRVNAALTIQLFSQLFHYINVICFNTIVTNSHMCTSEWGKVMTERLQLLETWAERQGLELAADCHLAKINQCAQFLQAPKNSVDEIHQLACSCFRLNSLQMGALLPEEQFSRNLIDTAVRMAQSVADELTRADGREIRLEESTELQLPLLLPDDGFSCDVVRGIPSGLVDFLNPLQAAGMCRLAAQPSSVGLWTVYMHQFNTRSPSAMSNKLSPPEVQTIKLHKNANGMGLSIVAAKGAGQERLGIYIKSVVPGGAADADGRLQAGDQLLRVDGQSLIGITQERAADYLVRTDAVVTLEVAKQGAIYHGLAKLLQQPSPLMQRGNRRMSDRDLNKPVGPLIANTSLPNSKSVPALHHSTGSNMANSKSRSTHSLAAASNAINNNDQGFYQNLSVYRAQNQNQPVLSERPPMPPHTMMNLSSGNLLVTAPHQQPSPLQQSHMPNSLNQSIPNQRPASSYYQTNNANFPNPHHHISASSTNLNGMGQQQQQQQQSMQSMTMGNRGGKLSQQNLRMNPMMAPSMPNIAGSNVGQPMGITSSQSMLNVNEHSLYPTNNPMMDQYHHNQPTPAQIRGHGKMMEMGEMMRRNQQRQEMDQAQMNLLNIPPKQQTMMHSPVKQHMVPPATAPKPTKGEDMPPLPPTNTHPLYKGSPITGNGGINYVASTLDPPKAAYYPINAGQSQKNYIAGNPWEREEREKEHEMRREHIRQWRDQQISELSTTQNRSSQQEEQLKTLVLERDFERRAQETEEGDEEVEMSSRHEVIRLSNSIQTPITTMKITEEDNNNSLPVADPQQSYQGYPIQQSQIVPTPSSTVQPKSILKNNRYDNSNISNPSYPSSPSKSQKSTSFADELHPPISVTATTTSSTSVNQLTRDMNTMDLNEDIHSTPPPPPPPERNSSYLIMSQQQKMRSSLTNNNVVNNVGSGMANSIKGTGASSSEMNKRTTLMTNNNVVNNNVLMTATTNNSSSGNNIVPTNLHSPNTAMSAFRDNKRVSFHDEENNKYLSSAATSPGSNNNMGDMYHQERMDFEMVREDPNRFIQETTAILQSPTSPDTDAWNSTVQSTPGVIGAQEFYRDPRTRRLAEAQQKQNQQKIEAVPEKLSFKEKMKMFALESGAEQTPKDKLKISRAQRDIDAVH